MTYAGSLVNPKGYRMTLPQLLADPLESLAGLGTGGKARVADLIGSKTSGHDPFLLRSGSLLVY